MKKQFAALLLTASLTTTALGCTSCAAVTSWWQNFQSNPVAQVQSFEQGVQIVLNVANTTWSTLSILLPPATVAQVQPVYNAAVTSVNDAMVALNDAVSAAVAAGTPTPNFSAAMQDVTNALAQVVAIINTWQSALAADAGVSDASTLHAVAPRVDDLNRAFASLKRTGGTK